MMFVPSELQTKGLEQVNAHITLPLIYRRPEWEKIPSFQIDPNLDIFILSTNRYLGYFVEKVFEVCNGELGTSSCPTYNPRLYVPYNVTHAENGGVLKSIDENDVPDWVDLLYGPSRLKNFLSEQVIWEYINYVVSYIVTTALIRFQNKRDQELKIPPHYHISEMLHQAVDAKKLFITSLDELWYYLDNHPQAYPPGSSDNVVHSDNFVNIRTNFDKNIIHGVVALTDAISTAYVNHALQTAFYDAVDLLVDDIERQLIDYVGPYLKPNGNFTVPRYINSLSLLHNFPTNGIIERRSGNYWIYSVSDPLNDIWRMV